MYLQRSTRVFFGLSGAAILALLGWMVLDGDFDRPLLLLVAIAAGLLVVAFTGVDPTSDEVIPPASERFLELADPERTIDAEAMISGRPRAGGVQGPASGRSSVRHTEGER